MNLHKAHLKATIIEELGNTFEDDLEVARVKVHKFQGSAEALARAKQVLTDLTVKARDDAMNGVVTFDSGNPLEVAKFVVARIQEGAAKLHEMAENARLMGLQAEGEVHGLDRVVKKMKGLRDEENNKLQSFMKAVDEGKVVIEDGSPRFVGDGPAPPGTIGLPIKMRRQMEEAKEAASSSPAATDDAVVGDNGAPKKAPTKRRKKVKAEADDHGLLMPATANFSRTRVSF